ncbi:ribonuclease Z [Methanomethylovorans hollandica DSM 15978]|uniref:Ribonuclease Z n=1 Tax=Methanomethylovorans hollandica (strain DSM 15978 / NBRC 107637 / DMS1) TaxID=867904 RepID=L0KY00_METHD|nr:ribonuclease Z [Methanomethylovorans hollandica]AGB48958.1 ribonuclease Z [Methanomethylovorans hollandica DSM 15978]
MLRILFLGTGGSLPTRNRNPSAIMVNREGELLLFDCGEGTQQQMMRAKTGMKALTSIFVTHFHADHMLGIPGLIQTMSFLGRTEPLYIYGPQWVKEFVKIISELGYYKLHFEVEVIEMAPGDIIKRNDYSIHAIGTDHSVPSLGYALIEDQRKGRFEREKAIALGVPPGPLFSKLHSGVDVEVNGKLIRSTDVVGQVRPGRKIVYTGDTRPCQSILAVSRDADVLIHDSTLGNDQSEWAKESKHSTASEAAILAKEAGVRKLVLTHISSRYTDDASPLLREAQEVFENVIIAEDMMEMDIPLKDE